MQLGWSRKAIGATRFKSVLGAFLIAIALAGLGCSGEAAPAAQEGENSVQEVSGGGGAANPAEPASVTVTDIAGRTVTIKQPVERIILGEGRQMYIVAALEPDDPFKRIAGWRDDLRTADLDTFNKYKEKYPDIVNIPQFGDPSSGEFSVEQALALEPDVFILNLGALEGAREAGLLDQLAEVGVPTVVIDYREDPLANTLPSTLLLGRILQQEEKAQEVGDFYLQQVNQVYSRIANLEGPQPTLFIDRAPGAGFFGDASCCATFGRANLGLLVEKAGGVHLGSDMIPGWAGEINPEQVLVADPQVIVATGSNWSFSVETDDPSYVRLGYLATPDEARAALQKLAERPGWDGLTAVQNGKFNAIWHQFYNSPYHFVALQVFAKWLYPEEFADLDPEATFKEFHDKFLPIDYSGVFWISLGD
jgi:iron complex transport system substrate-binding protein